MKTLNYPILLQFLLFHQIYTQQYPICIIGGGISGITIANSLQEKGYDNVHLYEASSRFGGKLDTFRSKDEYGDSIVIEKGPILYSDQMHYIVKHMNRVNLTTIPFNIHDHSLFNPKSGVIFPRLEFSAQLTAKVQQLTNEFKRFWHLLSEEALELGYNSPASRAKLGELATPIETWLKERNISELLPLFGVILTSMGYGDVKDTPAMYALKFIVADDAENFFKIGGPSFTVKEGFDTFAERMVETVKNKNLGWRAVDIKRNRDKDVQYVTFEVGAGKRKSKITQICKKTILAFPPLMNKLAVLVSDLSYKEKEVFNQVKIMKYVSSGNLIPSLNRAVYSGLVPEIGYDYNRHLFPRMIYPQGDGGPVVLVKQNKGERLCYNAYSWIYGDYSEPATDHEMEIMAAKLKTTLKKIHPFSKTLYMKTTEYFPHVTSQSIRNGFYSDFESIQGDGGLYYGTTLLTLECVNNAIELGEKLVAKYF